MPSPLEFVPQSQKLGPVHSDPVSSRPQRLARHLAGKYSAIGNPYLGCKIRALDVHMRRILVLEEHEKLAAAKPFDFGHARFPDRQPV